MHLTDHHKAILSRLLQGESWKVVMHVIGERLVTLETQTRQLGMDRDMRLQLMERKNELLDMVGRLYHEANEENPYDAAGGVLWATQMKLPEPEEAYDHTQPINPQAKEYVARKRAGSVA